MNTNGTDRSWVGYAFVALLYTQIVMVWAIATDNTVVNRLCSYLIMIISMGMFTASWIAHNKATLEELILLATAIYIVILLFVKNEGFSQFITAMTFFQMLTVWRSGRLISSDGIKRNVFFAYFLQAVLLAALFFSPLAYKGYREYSAISTELTLGLPNPNQTGVVLFSTITSIVLVLSSADISRSIRSITYILIVFLSYCLYLTKARTSIIALAVFLGAYIWLKKKPMLKKYPKLIQLSLWSPLLFMYGYIYLAKSRLGSAELLGKRLFSGRERLYEAILRVWDNKLLGNIELFGFRNSHNAYLTLLVNIGVIGFVLYIWQTSIAVRKLYKECNKRNQIMAVVAIIMLFIMGSAESAVLTGGTIYFTYLLTFVFFAHDNSEVI